jgi:4-nitrophenyl phosphatase
MPSVGPQLPIQTLDPPIRGLILDVDGVLWKDAEPIGDLSAAFSVIRALGLQVCIATNNAMNSIEHYRLKLKAFGVAVDGAQIITSAEATADTLLAAFPGRGTVFLVGEVGVERALEERGFQVVTDPTTEASFDAVVAGIDRDLSYARLQKASTLIRAGAPYYGTNPDPTFPTPAGLVPGAGAILAAISTASGMLPTVVGKPSPLLFETAARRMSLAAGELLVVGDRLETDIKGGQVFGARTAVVLSGVSNQYDVAAWKPAPTIVAPNLGALLGL